jgi:hypothetical protein
MNYTIHLNFNLKHDPEQEYDDKKRAALRAIQAVTMDGLFFEEPVELRRTLFPAEIELLMQLGDQNGSI